MAAASERPWRVSRPVATCLLAIAAALVAAGCVPEDRGPATEVSNLGVARSIPAPSWPQQGPPSADTLIAAVEFDLGRADETFDQWVPSRPQARCVGERLVRENPGAERLNALNYRPDRPGSRLTQLGWSAEERIRLATVFGECVDLQDAFAQVLVGDFRFDVKSAQCVARGLDGDGVLKDWASAWSERRELDLMAGEARIARAMVRQSEVCLGNLEFIAPESNQTAIRQQNPNAPTTTAG